MKRQWKIIAAAAASMAMLAAVPAYANVTAPPTVTQDIGVIDATGETEAATEEEAAEYPRWEKVSGTSYWYYYLAADTLAYGMWIDDYYVGDDGRMVTSQWVSTDDGWYYVDSTGAKITNQLYKISTDYYWFDEDGRMVTSDWRQTEEGKWYYFLDSGKAATSGWRIIDDEYYYFLKSGVLAVDCLVGSYRVDASGKWIRQ